MAPVARELSRDFGVLEPLQAARSLEGQVHELKDVLEAAAQLPVKLIGWSWGAMLSYILTAEYPSHVEKLVLVSSGAFEEKYASKIMEIRLSRLTSEEQEEVRSLMKTMDSHTAGQKTDVFARFGELLSKADSYEPLLSDDEVIECQYETFRNVWGEAQKLRESGRLLKYGRQIRCPVVAIHGDYDPHLSEGVREPLTRTLNDFRFILLRKCGHHPWLEKFARDEFFRVLRGTLS
jgi:pimeloyl-ACP methyl ester carboxylesterase